MIPNELIEEIKQRTDIVELIGEDLRLKPSGSNFKALSPFTNEKTPSFVVSRQKQIFKCFSTQKGGNVYTYLMEMHGMSFIEAVKFLASRNGITIEEDDNEKYKEQRETKELVSEAIDIVKSYYIDRFWKLKENPANRYAQKRNIAKASIDSFLLGYSPDDWDSCYKYMKGKGISDEVLIKTGNFAQGRSGLFDKFKGRLIFPINDYLGKTIGFGGRDLSSSKETAKYINSPQTDIYNKSRVLYGLDKAKDDIRRLGKVIICEGYLDVITMHREGFRNTVSTSGTALTPEMVSLLKRYADSITLIFDSDRAGKNAAKKALPLLFKNSIDFDIVLLPEGEDPDSILNSNGPNSMKLALRKAIKPIEFLRDLHFSENNSSDPTQLSKNINEAIEVISIIDDAIAKSLYINQISELYGVPQHIVDEAYNSKYSREKAQTKRFKNYPSEVDSQFQIKEESIKLSRINSFIIQCCLESYEFLELMTGELKLHPEIFDDSRAAQIFDYIQDLNGGDSPLDALMMNQECPDEIREFATSIVLKSQGQSTRWADFTFIEEPTIDIETTEPVVKRLLLASLTKEKESHLNELQNDLLGEEEISELLNRIKEIDRLKSEIKDELENY
ncbi:MAG: DNA primase [Candidatus Kapaibacteriales bacterium]